MSDFKNILLTIVDDIHHLWVVFFNLLEVLGKKGVLNTYDLDYIRNHETERFKKPGDNANVRESD